MSTSDSSDTRSGKQSQLTMLGSILGTSGPMAGLALGLGGYLRGSGQSTAVTHANDVLLICAVGFLVACYMDIFVMHNIEKSSSVFWGRVVEIIYLLSMTCMVISGILIIIKIV